MYLPMSWLKEYVDINCSIKEFCDAMTLSGSKVENYVSVANDIKKVVIGKIIKIENHPHADKLVICSVDVGAADKIQIVTGAKNVFEGAYVPVALDGATLANNVKINTGDLRGVKSEGMLCSVEELGFDNHDFPDAPENGIYIFKDEQPLGADVTDIMDLKDTVIEFEITSNRPDCFSIIGLAREAAATFKKTFKFPEIEFEEKADGDINEMVSVEIKNPDLCPRYIARVVKNVKIEPSPRWMRKRLRAAGVRPINNIVDITNYVMIELGQPMHAFDIDNIQGGKIIVRNAKDGESITTLDGEKRTLDSSMLVISDENKAVAIAGVMGGENSMVSGKASAILFESANFNGPNVRVTSQKLGLRTDASGKYEKGIDPNLSIMAVNRAVQLVSMLGAGEIVSDYVDCYPKQRERKIVKYSLDWINKLLGTNIPEADMIEIFEKLEIIVDKDTRTLTIPTFRPDLETKADLAEEVARFYGYDKIPTTLAAGTPTIGKKSYSQIITEIIKNAMVKCGLCEAMTFSFESPKVFEKLNISKDSKLREAITILNPLGEDFSTMRTTTLNGMLTSLSTNYNRRNEEAFLFEIGKVYNPKSLPLKELPDEKMKLTIGMYGNIDFYNIKGVAEHLFEVLGIKEIVEFIPEKSINYMHPGRTASVAIAGKDFGYIGELHPSVAKNYDIGTKVYIAVLDVQSLVENSRLVNTYKALPKFPSIIRDISMLVKEDIFVKEIENVIKNNGGEILESIALFDVYKGSQIDSGFKSVSYSITFRNPERTLVDDDVNSVMKNILNALKIELNAQLRDK